MLPWWLHPLALVAFVPLCSALLAISLPPGAYQIWGTPKFLSGESSTLLFVCGAVVMLRTSTSQLDRVPTRNDGASPSRVGAVPI